MVTSTYPGTTIMDNAISSSVGEGGNNNNNHNNNNNNKRTLLRRKNPKSNDATTATNTNNNSSKKQQIPSRAAQHEAGRSFHLDDIHDDEQHSREFETEETASDALSSINSTLSSQGQYEVIEYDPFEDGHDFYADDYSSNWSRTAGGGGNSSNHNSYNNNNNNNKNFDNNNNNNNNNVAQEALELEFTIKDLYFGPGNNNNNNNGNNVSNNNDDDNNIRNNSNNSSGKMMMAFPELDLVIEDDSPAAAALRANASIHVSSAGKAARAVHLQSLRRLAKYAALANKTGYVKGKPPRVPPSRHSSKGGDHESLFGSVANVVNQRIDEYNHDGESEEEGEEREIEQQQQQADDDTDHIQATITDGEDDNISDNNDHEKSIGILSPSDGDTKTNNNNNDDVVTNSTTHSTNNSSGQLDTIDERMAVDQNQIKNNHIDSIQHQLMTHKHLQQQQQNDLLPDGVAPGTVEAGKKVLGNVDPHDIIKLQRWRKKNRGSKRATKSYVKGKVIDGEHELYTLSIAVMIGVRQSISRTNMELNRGPVKRWVRIQDFRATEKYEFRPKGDSQTPPHLLGHTFKFKDYSPIVFAYLRRMYGVNEFDFLLSVCGNANFIEFISNAKSGQFFFYSSDGRYMIKTMTNSESKFLRRILPQYFKHCCENPNTIMTRFFGMYRVKLYHLRRNVKFVIMNSVYYTDKHLQLFYDLKGSSLGRDAKPGQAVLKDNDLRRSLPDDAFALKSDQRTALRKQIASDCEFLQQMDIMDYSMLVGVHYIPLSGRNHNSKLVKQNIFRKPKLVDDEQLSPARIAKAVLASYTDSDFPSLPSMKSLSDSNNNSSQPLRGSIQQHQKVPSWKNVSFDDGLDDDDCSYLMGSNCRPDHDNDNVNKNNHIANEETERKKFATIEKLYWPFHFWFDIHGYRRLKPLDAPYNTFTPEDEKILKGYNIPKFVPPPSDRKDGGFEMDLKGVKLPIAVKEPSGIERVCEGKIFYMGIIDILQEYTARKSLETTYRSMFAGSRGQVSCVPPKAYGERFLDFFDQYSVLKRRPHSSSGDDVIVVPAAATMTTTQENKTINATPNNNEETMQQDEGIEAFHSSQLEI